MKLIREITENVECIVEGSDLTPKTYFIEGIIMQSDIRNRNGRVYPKHVMMSEMERYRTQYIDQNRAYGELNHPTSPSINLDRVSHIFHDLREDGTNVIGRAKIMDTPMGKIVKSLIDEGAKLGISSRGMGSLKKNSSGIMEVQNDFTLTTAGDIVADPSGPDCFVNGIMEGVDFYWGENGKLMQVAEETKEQIENAVSISKHDKKMREKLFFESFSRYINSIGKSSSKKYK